MRRQSELRRGGGGRLLLPRPPFCCCGYWEQAGQSHSGGATLPGVQCFVCRRVSVQTRTAAEPVLSRSRSAGTTPCTSDSPRTPGRPPLQLDFAHPDPGLCPAFPGPALSVGRPRSRRAAAEDAAGPEPRGRCWSGPLSLPREVCREAPFSAPKPSAGQRLPEQARAAAAPTRHRTPARHHVLRQVRLLRPFCLVHGTGLSPGGADPAPGPAPRHVPSARLLHLPRGLCVVCIRELARLPLHHQLFA